MSKNRMRQMGDFKYFAGQNWSHFTFLYQEENDFLTLYCSKSAADTILELLYEEFSGIENVSFDSDHLVFQDTIHLIVKKKNGEVNKYELSKSDLEKGVKQFIRVGEPFSYYDTGTDYHLSFNNKMLTHIPKKYDIDPLINALNHVAHDEGITELISSEYRPWDDTLTLHYNHMNVDRGEKVEQVGEIELKTFTF